MQWCTTPYSPSTGFTWEGFCQAHGVYYDCAINRTCPGLGLDPNDVNPAPPVGQVVDDYAGGSPATITLTATCPDCSVQPTSVNFELDGTDSDCLFDDATDSTGPPFEATTGSLTTGTYYLGAQFVGGDIDTEEHCFQLIVDPTPRTIDTTILFGEGFQPFTIFDGDGFVQSLINPLLEKPNTQAINLANYPSDCLSLAFALAGQSAINGVHLNDADGFGPDQYIAPATQYIGCNPILSTTGSRDLIVSLCDSDGGTAAGGCTTAVDTATFNLAISDTSSCNDDGTVDDGEQCDDGAADNNDTSRCKADCTLNRCGDVKICSDATGGFQCGDTQQTTVESCDDGNEDDVVCNALCSASACGNGTVEFDLGEECDNGPGASPGQTAATTTCFANCQLKLCGDGSRDPPEECDDRNDESGDGCSSNCNCECAIDPECLTCP